MCATTPDPYTHYKKTDTYTVARDSGAATTGGERVVDHLKRTANGVCTPNWHCESTYHNDRGTSSTWAAPTTNCASAGAGVTTSGTSTTPTPHCFTGPGGTFDAASSRSGTPYSRPSRCCPYSPPLLGTTHGPKHFAGLQLANGVAPSPYIEATNDAASATPATSETVTSCTSDSLKERSNHAHRGTPNR